MCFFDTDSENSPSTPSGRLETYPQDVGNRWIVAPRGGDILVQLIEKQGDWRTRAFAEPWIGRAARLAEEPETGRDGRESEHEEQRGGDHAEARHGQDTGEGSTREHSGAVGQHHARRRARGDGQRGVVA